MSSKLGSLAKFNREIPLHHKSTFDFGSFEITEFDKQKVIRAEAIIAKRFKDYSEATFDICKNLYDVSLTLKAEGKFMEWCEHVRLTKDKVSELLKRYELYMELYDGKEWVSSLSGKAVRILTHKDVPKELIYRVYEGGIKTADEIKQYIEYSIASDQKVLKLPQNEITFFSDEIESIDREDNEKNIEHIPEEIIKISESKVEYDTDPSTMIETAIIIDNVQVEHETDEILKNLKTIKKEINVMKNNPQIQKYKNLIQTLKRELEDLEKLFDLEEEKSVTKNNKTIF